VVFRPSHISTHHSFVLSNPPLHKVLTTSDPLRTNHYHPPFRDCDCHFIWSTPSLQAIAIISSSTHVLKAICDRTVKSASLATYLTLHSSPWCLYQDLLHFTFFLISYKSDLFCMKLFYQSHLFLSYQSLFSMFRFMTEEDSCVDKWQFNSNRWINIHRIQWNKQSLWIQQITFRNFYQNKFFFFKRIKGICLNALKTLHNRFRYFSTI